MLYCLSWLKNVSTVSTNMMMLPAVWKMSPFSCPAGQLSLFPLTAHLDAEGRAHISRPYYGSDWQKFLSMKVSSRLKPAVEWRLSHKHDFPSRKPESALHLKPTLDIYWADLMLFLCLNNRDPCFPKPNHIVLVPEFNQSTVLKYLCGIDEEDKM